MQSYLEKLNTTRNYLIGANFLLGLFLVLLSNLGVIPLQTGDLMFFTALSLVFALYRPGWAFLFFVGSIGFETVNLAPGKIGLSIRPYQLIGAVTVLAVVIRLISGKLNLKLSKIKSYDWFVVILVLASFLSAFFSENMPESLKLSLILTTFAVFYFLVKNYIETSEDLKKIIPFFLSSAIVITSYGIWQNWRFMHNLASFEVMPGRPNATFPEPDWLGIYLVFLIALIYSLLFYLKHSTDSDQEDEPKIKNLKTISVYALLALAFVALILTVSRSAWLGAFFVTIVFLLGVFTDFRFRTWNWKKTLEIKLGILSCLLISLAAVYIFHLTNFQLFNRLESTGSGLQKITVSCQSENIILPEIITDIDELEKFGCRHINLEEIGHEKKEGRFVKEITRYDPNVKTRSEIYKKSWEQIKKHPVLGIGWGSISTALGKDGRGASLNSSNIFLETYLGAGFLGFLAIVLLWLLVFFENIWKFRTASEPLSKAIGLFFVTGWFALAIPNFFNAGLFLGFLWLWLGIISLKTAKTT